MTVTAQGGVATEDAQDRSGSRRQRALVLLAVAELCCMALWFSASAVAPALKSEWLLSETQAGWLTLSVQLGFVAGTLLSAVLNLPDVLSTRRLLAASAFLGTIVNALFALSAGELYAGLALRFLTGLFLAGVYPPGITNSRNPKENQRICVLG